MIFYLLLEIPFKRLVFTQPTIVQMCSHFSGGGGDFYFHRPFEISAIIWMGLIFGLTPASVQITSRPESLKFEIFTGIILTYMYIKNMMTI